MYIHFDEEVICNDTYVALRHINTPVDSPVANTNKILISPDVAINERLTFFQIVDIGRIAEKETGLKKDDYVLADGLSSYYKSEPVCIVQYNNIIVKTDENCENFYPLNNKVFVVPSEEEFGSEEMQSIGGIYVPGNARVCLRVGVIKAIAANLLPKEEEEEEEEEHEERGKTRREEELEEEEEEELEEEEEEFTFLFKVGDTVLLTNKAETAIKFHTNPFNKRELDKDNIVYIYEAVDILAVFGNREEYLGELEHEEEE